MTFRRIWRLFYLLRSQATLLHYCHGIVQLGTFPLMVKAEVVWINHCRQSPPLTDEGSLCEC